MLLESAATDWLNTKPVFYNEKTGAISHNMNEVIDYSNFAFNPDGLRNYLKFGYTVYGQTMVENVKSLDWCSQITKDANGTLKITHLDDIAHRLWNPGMTNGSQVFEKIIESTREWANAVSTDSKIVLPLSGGLDSRLLAYSVKNIENVKSYSYGLSADQSISFEVVKAKQIAKKCDIAWEQVELEEYFSKNYIDEWYKLYGPSVHLHGMYQMEFYKKILGLNPDTGLSMLSGIIGDGWAGTVRIPDINSAKELVYLGYTHGMSIDEDVCLLKGNGETEEEFYNVHCDELKDESFRVLYAMRFKMMLLNYLLKTPEALGMNPWSPFIVPDIAMSILNLDWDLKEGRLWQHKEFEKLNLDIGWEKNKCDYNLVIDIETLRKNKVSPLNVELLSRVIKRDFVEYVNKKVCEKVIRVLPAKPRTMGNVYNKVIKRHNSSIEQALNYYEILGSIEKLMVEVETHNG